MLSAVEAKNFQSWEKMNFPVTKGVTLIDGRNLDDGTSEGSGKSAVVNAIAWCIYGQLPKDAKIDDVIRYGQPNGGVSAKFFNGDQIVRFRKPNDLFIQLASGKIVKGKDAKETQDLIEDYVGCNFETFCQSTYFAQNYDKKFLTSNQENKGKILSSIQNINIFDKARKEVMDLLKIENEKIISMTQKLEIEKNNLQHVNSKIKMLDEFMQTKQRQYDQSKADLQKKIERSQNELAFQEKQKIEFQDRWTALSTELNGQLDNQPEMSTELEAIRAKVGEITGQKSQVTTHNRMVTQMNNSGVKTADRYNKLNMKRAEIDYFIRNPSSKCPSCGSELKNVDLSHSVNELNAIDIEMAELLGSLKDIGKYLDDNKLQDLNELETSERSLRARVYEIESLQSRIKSRQKEIDGLKWNLMAVDTNASATKLTISRQQLDLVELKLPDNTKELAEKTSLSAQLYEVAEKYGQLEHVLNQAREYALKLEKLKDGFREIKSYVFNNALNELNFRTNHYLNELFQVEARIKFTTEDQKIETQIVLDGTERSLGLLSGGQHRRFNLAVDLALSDLVAHRKTSKLNLLILDEYFKDLSEASMEKCLDLLKSRKSPVIIIEHNSIFKNIVDNTFFVELENGVSHESRQ